MPTIPEALAVAIAHHQAGRLQAAEQIYRQILAVEPDSAAGWHLLGVVAHQSRRHEEAVECIQRAIRLNGRDPAFHSNLGEAYRALKKPAEAIACYQRALEINPALAETHYNLGNAYKDQGRLAEAIASFRRALELKPGYVPAHNNLGNALRQHGQAAEAIACFHRALQLKPDFVEARNNLGLALQDQGRPAEAVACFQQALQWKPDFVEAQSNLGNSLVDLGSVDEAIACYRRALERRPDFAEAHYSLGFALHRQGRLSEAVACCRRAVQLRPDYAEAHNNLGVALRDQGRVAEALAAFQQAMQVKPDHIVAHCNYLFTLHYRNGTTLAELAAAHEEFERRHAAPLRATWPANENVRDPQRRLRVGFLSADLRRHPVGYFLIRVLEGLDRRQCETVCYFDQRGRDELTARFQAAAAEWHDVAGQSDAALAEKIRGDGIDILFDLAGHTAHNRLLVFARKPAPIQITWIGYEGTTGLAAMDYLLADHHTAPEGSERFCREHVLRMPDGYLCYDPPDAAPPVGPPPSLDHGYATFGSFNNLAKITPEVVAVWAEILRRAPTARLILKYFGLADEAVRQRYLDQFAAGGIQPQRLDLQPPSPYEEYLATYHRVDLVLDPFPFSGGLTTCEALWMGVPVITCPGETFASRHSLGHLWNVGLTETITRDFSEYVELAVALAGDLPRLSALRAGLRQRMAASPLCDAERFATHWLALMRDVWRQEVLRRQ